MGAKTVLIVDDIPLMRTMLRKYVAMLGAAGYSGETRENFFTVVEATNGAEALAVLAQRRIDFIFLDLMMPEMDGMTFLERTKDDAARRRIPLVVTTALCEDEAVDRALALGARSYITKPYTLDAVKRELGVLLEEKDSG